MGVSATRGAGLPAWGASGWLDLLDKFALTADQSYNYGKRGIGIELGQRRAVAVATRSVMSCSV